MVLTSSTAAARRDVLVRALDACLRAAQGVGEPAQLLERSTVDAARKLTTILTTPGRRRTAEDVPAFITLAWLTWYQYQVTGARAQYDQSLYWFREVYAVAPNRVPPAIRRQLGSRSRTARTSHPAPADDGRPVSAVPPDPADASDRVIQTGRLYLRYRETRDPDVLREVVRGYRIRFERTGDRRDIEAAVLAARDAVAAAPAALPDRAEDLLNLSTVLLTRFDNTAGPDPRDLDQATRAVGEALALLGAKHPDRARYLLCLSGALRRRFEHGGDFSDADAAVSAAVDALDATRTGHPDRRHCLLGLAHTLSARFRSGAGERDRVATVGVVREALSMTPPGHPDRRATLELLGTMLIDRFDRTGRPADLDEAVALLREAGSSHLSRVVGFGTPAN